MSFHQINDGSTTPRRAAAAGREVVWPVLARLPWVGESAAQAEPLPSQAAQEPLPGTAAPHLASPTLRTFESIASNPAGPDPLELLTLDEPSPPPRRNYVDRPHAAVRGYDWPAATEASAAIETAIRETSGRRTLRIDPGASRSAISISSPLPQRSTEQPRSTFAAHVFQLHAAAAPYAGLMMTLALVTSASLLCWLTFVQPQKQSVPNNAPSPAAWPTETAKQTPPIENSSASTSPRVPVIEYPAPLLVQTHATPRPDYSSKADTAVPKIETPSLTLNALAVEAKTAESKTPAVAPHQSPAPAIAPYPSTPYAVIDFGKPAVPTVAQRPSSSTGAPSATR